MTSTLPPNLKREQFADNSIEFRDGLPGFPNCHRFVITQKPEERPFAWLQSLTDPNLAFALVDAYAWIKDFEIEIEDELLEELGSVDPLDYAVFLILRIQKQDNVTTLRAKPNAPVIVNIRTRQARQIVVMLNPKLKEAEALCLKL